MAAASPAAQPLDVKKREPLRAGPALSTVLCTLALLTVGFLVVYPIVLLLYHSFEVGPLGRTTHWGLDNWQSALETPGIVMALWNTVSLAVTRQGIAIVLGVTLAWLIARTDLPGRDWLEFGFWIAVFLPSLTVTLGWIMLLDGHGGLINRWLEHVPFIQLGVFDVYSWWGIVWVHLVTGTLPIKVMLLTPAFRNMDASLEEASRTSGAGTLGTLFRVAIPLIAPTVLVVLLIGMIRSLEAFEIELVLGTPANIDVYSTVIYRSVLRPPLQFGEATVLSMMILAIMLPLVAVQQWYTGRRSHATVSGKFRSHLTRLGAWRWPLFALVLSLVLVMTVLPIALVVTGTFMKIFGQFGLADAWTLDHWRAALASSNFTRAMINSIIIAGGTALLAMALCSSIAYIIVRSAFAGRGVLDFLVWLPSTLPGIVIGLGYLWLFLGTPWLRPIYGTTFLLVLVAALGSMTLTTQVIKGSLLQLGAELEEASWASGASWWYGFRRVILPLMAPAIAAVGVLAFAGAAASTSHVALLATHGNQPLSILQLNLLSHNDFEAASVIGVFILLMTVGVALLARLLGLKIGLGGTR
jgi:iron(III) transport system permease protein